MENFFRGNGIQEALQPASALVLLETAHDFHDGDDGDRVPAKGFPVRGGVAGNVGVDSFSDLREDIGIKQRFIHREIAATVAVPDVS
jgi:hypothetical protein